MNITEKYNYLKSLVVSERKEQFDTLINYLESQTAYLTAPASTKYYNAYPGGLLEHAVNVTTMLIKIKNQIAPEITNESCVIAGLFHDVGKAGIPDYPYYVANEPTEKQKAYGYPATTPYRLNENLPYLTVAHRSIRTVQRMFDLTEEEYQAILLHDGQMSTANESYAFKECKLASLLHMADYYDCRYTEGRAK